MIIDLIEAQKKEYISKVAEKSRRFKRVMIYGAGKMARVLSRLLCEQNIEFWGYCVTKAEENLQVLESKMIVSLDEIRDEREDVLFLIAVKKSKSKEIIANLEKRGYTNYIAAPELIGYFDKQRYDSCLNPEMEITVRVGCRVNCKYCPQKKLMESYQGERVMSLDTFKTCVDKLPDETVIIFSGFCEPFLNEACIDMILYAFEKKRKVKLFTTLEGLTRENFEKIKNLDFEEVVLHLPDQYGYAQIRVDDTYMDLLECVINSVKGNGESFINYANSQFEVSEEIKKIVRGKIRITGEMNDRAGNLEGAGLVGGQSGSGRKRFCTRAFQLNHNVLLPNGDVVVCCMDFGLRHKLGNLIESTYKTAVIDSLERKNLVECLQGNCDSHTLCDRCSNIEHY